jgi:hypothetical protein
MRRRARIGHVGRSVPACSAPMYEAYQVGQSSSCPVRFSCSAWAASPRRSAPARSAADAYAVPAASSRPGTLVRARRGRGVRLAERDRAPGARRRELDDRQAVERGDVVVEPPTQVFIELLGSVDVGHGDEVDLELHVDLPSVGLTARDGDPSSASSVPVPTARRLGYGSNGSRAGRGGGARVAVIVSAERRARTFGLANRAGAFAGSLAVLTENTGRFAASLGSPRAAGEVRRVPGLGEFRGLSSPSDRPICLCDTHG